MLEKIRIEIKNGNYFVADKLINEYYEKWLHMDDKEAYKLNDEINVLFIYMNTVSKKLADYYTAIYNATK